MNITQQHLLRALSAALVGAGTDWDAPTTPEEWKALFDLAQQHHVLPLVYEAAARCPSFACVGSMAKGWKQRSMQLCYLQVRRTDAFLSLYQKLNDARIPALVVKGLICRRLYPNGDLRLSSDEDLLIRKADFLACHDLFLRSDMALTEPDTPLLEVYEVAYQQSVSPLRIELHKSLFPSQSEAYGDWNRFFDGCFDRAVTLDVEGVSVATLSPTDHCFYLLCHAFKHFLHSGFGIRQVCDICLFAQANADAIDWDRVWQNCRAIRCEGFAQAVFNIGAKHLDLHGPVYEIDELPLLEDLLSGGVYGSSSEDRLHSSTITLDAVSAQKQRKAASGLRAVFPKRDAMAGRYPMLKKHPWLLPAAWADRLIKYGKNHKASNAAESLKIGRQRVELLRFYNVIE